MDIQLPYSDPQKGGNASPIISDARAQLTQPYGGKYYEAARRGRLFHGSSAAAGVVIPIYTNTAQVFGIWNPPNSGVLGVLAKLRMTYNLTTQIAGGFVLGILRDVGQVAATAGPISAFTKTTATCERGRTGNQQGGNKIQFTGSAATITDLITSLISLGINHLATTAADATVTPFTVGCDFDGEVCLEPGNALFLCSNKAQAGNWIPTLSWIEDPV